VQAGKGFVYRHPSGRRVRDEATLARIRSLAVPPAWRNDWICPSPNGHVQATGRDARGRKQYRYHPRWTATRDDAKYGRLLSFGQYIDADGLRQSVDSANVNAYLRELAGEDFTAKDFRTWAGTILAACALRELAGAETMTARKRRIVEAIDHVAERLGNTRAICHKCYVHPEVLDAYLEGSTIAALSNGSAGVRQSGPGRLSSEERAVLSLLRQRISRQTRRRGVGERTIITVTHPHDPVAPSLWSTPAATESLLYVLAACPLVFVTRRATQGRRFLYRNARHGRGDWHARCDGKT
jgi:DNA topoisomerase I